MKAIKHYLHGKESLDKQLIVIALILLSPFIIVFSIIFDVVHAFLEGGDIL